MGVECRPVGGEIVGTGRACGAAGIIIAGVISCDIVHVAIVKANIFHPQDCWVGCRFAKSFRVCGKRFLFFLAVLRLLLGRFWFSLLAYSFSPFPALLSVLNFPGNSDNSGLAALVASDAFGRRFGLLVGVSEFRFGKSGLLFGRGASPEELP